MIIAVSQPNEVKDLWIFIGCVGSNAEEGAKDVFEEIELNKVGVGLEVDLVDNFSLSEKIPVDSSNVFFHFGHNIRYFGLIRWYFCVITIFTLLKGEAADNEKGNVAENLNF